jgi:hypothetical protein
VFELKERKISHFTKINLQGFSQSERNISLHANCDGSFICIQGKKILTKAHSTPSEIKVFSLKSSEIYSHECVSNITKICWDVRDPRILTCEVSQEKGGPKQIMTFYASSLALIYKDSVKLPDNAIHLLGTMVPNLILQPVYSN